MKKAIWFLSVTAILLFGSHSFASDLDLALKSLPDSAKIKIHKAAFDKIGQQPQTGDSGFSQVICYYENASLTENNHLNDTGFRLIVACENSAYGAFVSISGTMEDGTANFDLNSIQARLR